MKCARCIIYAGLLVLGVGLLAWLGMTPSSDGGASGETPAPHALTGPPIRIGLIPERDIFAQRASYRALADYLSQELSRPVELLTTNAYDGVLRDFEEKRVDAAFLGSLVTVLTVDRLNASVLVKPELPGKRSTYRGVIIVPESSAIQRIEDLAGKSIAMVRTTTAGNLFPMQELLEHGLLEHDKAPKLVWVGTHDDVIAEVNSGRVDAGALKDRRLDDHERAFPHVRFRRLALSQSVPENALVVREDLKAELGPRLADLLLKMDQTPRGREALKRFGAERFLPCGIEEYEAIYRMVDVLAGHWSETGMEGPPPRHPATAASATAVPAPAP